MKTKTLTLVIFAASLLLFAGCDDDKRWYAVRYVPTTEAERKAVAEQVAKIMSATPRSLSGNDQDWDDAIKAATHSAMTSLCRPTLWEYAKYGRETGNWRYLSENTEKTK